MLSYNCLLWQYILPMNRTIVLESFTAVNNYNVSYINNIIEELRKKHTDQFIVINIHDGEDAIPKSGQPDFRTQYGTRIADLLDGHAPRGSFNRERSPNIDDPSGSTGIAVRSTYWELSAAEVAAEISPVNIAVRSEWIDRETIEIKIEAYFTDNCEPGCLLNVALIENGVVGYQEGPVDNPNLFTITYSETL
jgi:hypothetical protein